MLRFTGRRVLWAIPTLFIISFLVFAALRAGTDPVASYLRVNPRASAEKIQQYVGLGCTGFYPWCSDYPDTETVRLFAERVAPQLR